MALQPKDHAERVERHKAWEERKRAAARKYADKRKREALESGTYSSVPPVNRERKKKRREEGEVYGPHHRHVATLPCIIADREGHECVGPVQSHHVKTVGAGGVDRANCVPLCYGSHSEVHASGLRTFEDRWEIDLDMEAARIWQEAVG